MSEELDVVVIGAGIAGSAAAWRLATSGAKVRLVADRAGASELYSGALDFDAGDASQPEALPVELLEFAGALGGWTLERQACRVATHAGVIRQARAADSALLDLEGLVGRRIAVIQTKRDEWDADLLARALVDSEWARRTGTEFELLELELLSHPGERYLSSVDFAELHDAAPRRQLLIERLTEHAGYDGFLLGPWLGSEPETAAAVRAGVGKPLGEVCSRVGGPAGARFARASARLFELNGIQVLRDRVESLRVQGKGVKLELASGDALSCQALVLAVGGVVSGGVVLDAAVATPATNRSFRLGLDAPVELWLDGRYADAVSTLFGVDFQAHGAGILERVGVHCDGARVVGLDGVVAAGDVVAGAPHTALAAAHSGILAAAHLLSS